MAVVVRVAFAVAAAVLTVAAAPSIAPDALRHHLVPGERFVYESTEGEKTSLLAARTEFTVLEVTPAGTTVRQRDYMWERLSFDGTIRTDAAQGSWRYTAHPEHGPSIVPVWDPKRYGRPPAKSVGHRIEHTTDGDEDVTEHVLPIAADAITIAVDATFRGKPAETAVGVQLVSVVRRMEMTWTSGVLSEYRFTVSTAVTLNGRTSSSFEGQTIHRLVEHTVPR